MAVKVPYSLRGRTRKTSGLAFSSQGIFLANRRGFGEVGQVQQMPIAGDNDRCTGCLGTLDELVIVGVSSHHMQIPSDLDLLGMSSPVIQHSLDAVHREAELSSSFRESSASISRQ